MSLPYLRRLAVAPALFLVAVASPRGTLAQLTVTIPTQTASRPLSGTSFAEVSGTITNTGADPLYLSNFAVSDPLGFGNVIPFYLQQMLANGPYILAPGASASGVLFSAAILPELEYAPSTLPGAFRVVGGATRFSTEASGQTNWTLNLASASTVPEPATLALSATGLLAIGAPARRRQRR